MAVGFTNLTIWQKAHELTLVIYKVTSHFPSEEKFGLTSQLRRAAVSVEANIAESFGRYHYSDAINFLLNSRGSILEVQDELIIVRDLKYDKTEEIDKIIDAYLVLTKQLNKYITYKRNEKLKS